jgi:exopolyphosphatase/guanosine-5'-triphosphate,3'-diphosphate pyrophosphatase
MQQRVGIIDLGSNTTRLIVLAYQHQNSFHLMDEVRETVRLAQGVGDNGLLQPQSIYRALEVMKMFHSFCQATGVQQIIAVATSALRDATNQDDFLRLLKQETGMDMRILDGEEEAYYGYLGVVNSTSINDGFIIDIGGGSTEISEVYRRTFNRAISQAVGVVRFTERYVHSDPISNKDFRALSSAAADAFASVEWLQAAPGRMLVGIGGTVRNLARIDQKRRDYPLERIHGYVLTRKALDNIIGMLRKKTLSERASISGLNSDRADVIIAGAVILYQLMEQGGFDDLMVGGQGLRDGLFYEHFLGHQRLPLFNDVRGFTVENLAHLYDYEQAHAEKVRELSLQLFDQLQPLHGYGPWERELLSYAALLHDIGVQVGYYDHHKHSAYILLNSSLPGFDHREVALLALLVRSHRKGSVPVGGYRAVLSNGDDERATRLGSLLRLAEYLERSKSQIVRDLRVEFEGNMVRVWLSVNADAAVELWNVNQRTGLFKKAFGRDIEVLAATEE